MIKDFQKIIEAERDNLQQERKFFTEKMLEAEEDDEKREEERKWREKEKQMHEEIKRIREAQLKESQDLNSKIMTLQESIMEMNKKQQEQYEKF